MSVHEAQWSRTPLIIIPIEPLVAAIHTLEFFIRHSAAESNARDHEVVTAKNLGHFFNDVGVSPLIEAPTVTTDATPMMIRLKSKKARNLWAKIDWIAIRRASV